MSTNTRHVRATPLKVWEVLSDGWLYPVWVVGASRMRDVDAAWPAQGAKLHHSVGVWPLLINDNTEVLESQPGERLVLRGRGWPAGEVQITITLTAETDGTRVTILEDPVKGPAALIPKAVRTPLLAWRNTETLRRLAFVVENRARS